jgi:hypothetical protein
VVFEKGLPIMNKIIPNYCMATVLFLLLGLNIASIVTVSMSDFHDISGLLLALASLAHCALHRPVAQAFYRRLPGKIRLIVNGAVMLALLLAVMTGLVALVKPAAGALHEITGGIVLLALLVHGARHLRWMAAVSARLLSGGREPAPQIPELPPESLN